MRLLATDELGLVRVATAACTDKLASLAMVARWGEAARARRIVRCRLGEAGDGDGSGGGGGGGCAANGWLALARHDHTVDVIECASGLVMGGGGIAMGGLPVSVDLYGPGPGRAGARLITVTEGGDAVVHAAPCDPAAASQGFGADAAVDRIVEEWTESVRWKAMGHAARGAAFSELWLSD
jgi:ribosome biogenesis protein NSA1